MQLFAHLIPIIALALHVNAHGVITAVTGTNGVTGQGFGVDASTPRDGSRRNPFQQDTSIIRDREIAQGTTGVCGRTLGGGNNNVEAQMTAASSAGLPMAAADGTVTMTLHQVNADGAGPYTCQVSADGTGQDFVQMTVTQNVPGVASLSLARAKDIPLVAQMPAGTACTGGPNGDACLVRCRNAAIAGPFGSCVAVTNAGSGNASATAAAGTGAAAGSVTAAAGASGANATGINGGAAVNGSANGQSANGTNNGAGTGVTGQPGTAIASGSANGGAAVTGAGGAGSGGASGSSAVGGASGLTGAVGDPVAPGGLLDNLTGGAAGGVVDAITGKLGGLAGKAGLARRKQQQQQQPKGDEAALQAGNFTIPDVSIEEAEAALAQDLERRILDRVRRSRIVGRRSLNVSRIEGREVVGGHSFGASPKVLRNDDCDE